MEKVDADAIAAMLAQVKAGDVDLGGYLDMDTSSYFDPSGRWINEAYIAQALEDVIPQPGATTTQY